MSTKLSRAAYDANLTFARELCLRINSPQSEAVRGRGDLEASRYIRSMSCVIENQNRSCAQQLAGEAAFGALYDAGAQ